MDANEYLKIVYTGIVENSDYLESYIKREQLKAANNHIEREEFIDRLNKAIISVINKFQVEESKRLNTYYLFIEKDRQSPEGQKFDYPIEKPTINSFSLPLFQLTNGYYKDQLYFSQVRAFFLALKKIVDTLVEENEVKKKMHKSEDSNKPTYLHILLKEYYIKGCKELTMTQVANLNTGNTKKGLNNKFDYLHINNYKPTKHHNSIREFKKVYEKLIMEFEAENTAEARIRVIKDLELLNKDNPNLK
jgi:hypothetical protein